MSSDNQAKIQELWVNEQCPEANGIIFGNGIIKRIELIRDDSWKPEKLIRKNENQTTVTDFLDNSPDGLTTVYQLCEKIVLEHNIRLVGGEADWGDFGFVAVENLETKQLQFLLFFDNSNPFVEVDFVEPNIIAMSNLRERWIIPIDEPEKVTVFASPT